MLVEQRVGLHKAFWDGSAMKEPIVSFKIGDYFFADKFKANKKLLVPKTVVTANMVNVDDYLETYEQMFNQCEAIGQSGFFTAEPCTAIPWMEAMMGATVSGEGVAFTTHPKCSTILDIGKIKFDLENVWTQKYLEFVTKLTKLSNGRFPVGQPILRGFSDCIGALMGQTDMIWALIDEPEVLAKRFDEIADFHLKLTEETYKIVQRFHGGYSMGFYHLWAPDKTVWYQDDLTALMSPTHYEEFIKQPSEKICSYCDYSLVHLHSNSFFHLDGILSVEKLKCVEINKDVTGLTVSEMIPAFLKVINANKSLVIWGNLTEDEIKLICDTIPQKRLHLNLITPTIDSAHRLNSIVKTAW